MFVPSNLKSVKHRSGNQKKEESERLPGLQIDRQAGLASGLSLMARNRESTVHAVPALNFEEGKRLYYGDAADQGEDETGVLDTDGRHPPIVTGDLSGVTQPNLIAKLPDGFQERAAADILILSDQSYAFRSSRRPDESVGGIARIILRKLRGQRCNLDCDRLHYDPDGF
jgi:hypothetical protein